jgi:hypothetical protein
MVSSDRLQIVQDPVRQGRYALRAKVIQGDDPINASGNRNELIHTKNMPSSGDERYYSWSTLWPSDYASANTWQLFTQFHHTGPNGSPPVEMFARGEKLYLRVSGSDVWQVPLERGRWHDFVLHVKWSPNASSGFVELWYDGKLSLPKTYGATLFEGQSVYLKQGLYRDAAVSPTQTIYHDGMTVATSLDDVMTSGGEVVNNTPTTPTKNNTGSGSDTLGSQTTQAAQASGCASTGSGVAAGMLALLLFALRRPLALARRKVSTR